MIESHLRAWNAASVPCRLAALAPVLALALGAANAPLARPATRLAVAAGTDPYGGDTRMERIALYRDSPERRAFRNWTVLPYWGLGAGHWHSAGDTRASDLNDVGVRFGARLEPKVAWVHGLHPYIDASTGVHYLTETGIHDRNLSTHVQFGTAFGLGVVFGRGGRFDLGWRFMHFSNAEIKEPNDGMNLNLMVLGYRF